jgi:hypothetical protein
MPAVTPSPSQVGRLSFSARFTSSGTTDTIDNAAILALCEQGPLYQFFATAYPSDAAMIDAWAAAGGLALCITTTPSNVPQPAFSRDGNGKPTLSITGTGAPGRPVALRVALSYSASR